MLVNSDGVVFINSKVVNKRNSPAKSIKKNKIRKKTDESFDSSGLKVSEKLLKIFSTVLFSFVVGAFRTKSFIKFCLLLKKTNQFRKSI